MTDLSDFLLARIAEDEAVAHAAGNLKMWLDDRGRCWIEHPDGGRIELGNKMDTELVVGRWLNHVALHMPGRVLAECEAKQRIVKALAARGPDAGLTSAEDRGATWALRESCKALATPYADHPDYDEAWRP